MPGTDRGGRRVALLAAFVMAAGSLAACAGQTVRPPADGEARQVGGGSRKDPESGTFYGAASRIGNGIARSYLTLQDGSPIELGVALSEHALTGLSGPDAGSHAHLHMSEHLLSLPQKAASLPFTFVELNWNPAGHEPTEIYGVPHFDFHFYTITRPERDAIDPADPGYGEKAGRFPSPEFIPTGYVAANVMMGGIAPELASVPRMGMHWADPESPELAGEPFSRTHIYGTWDGKLTFLEPMIAKAFLESRPNFSSPIATAARYEPAGLYPSEYRVYWNSSTREYRVALSAFVDRS